MEKGCGTLLAWPLSVSRVVFEEHFILSSQFLVLCCFPYTRICPWRQAKNKHWISLPQFWQNVGKPISCHELTNVYVRPLLYVSTIMMLRQWIRKCKAISIDVSLQPCKDLNYCSKLSDYLMHLRQDCNCEGKRAFLSYSWES